MENVKIPDGVNVELKNSSLVVTGSGKTFEVPFNSKVLAVKVSEGQVSVSPSGKQNKFKNACVNTIIAHLKNTFVGISTGFSKKLQVVYSHFPVSIEVKGSEVLIKNFLGEKVPRTATIIGDSKVEVKGQDVTVSGSNKYGVGQTANNLVTATKIRKKDRRIFQDGIYPVI